MKRSEQAKPSIRVMKFGGTCLHPAANRSQAVARIVEAVEAGHGVVAVVSAMGRVGDPYATDTLESLLPHATPGTSRERDALLSCGEGISASLIAAELYAQGIPAVSLHGYQLGLVTNGDFGRAEILTADPTFVKQHLDKGYVVIAAGFQGVGEDGSLTTLGRGGSDTTAVALAAALGVDQVLFFKDVDCLYTADPKIVPGARPLNRVPYDEAAHLAYAGAKILHPRSADLAQRQGVSIRIRSLSGSGEGTLVSDRETVKALEPAGDELFAVTCLDRIGQIRAAPDPERACPEFPCRLFEALAGAGLSLDMINVFEHEVFFTVPEGEVCRAAEIAAWEGCTAQSLAGCAKVSLLGGGIHGVPGIMSRILSALSDVEVPVLQSVDTYTVISVLVRGSHAPRAAQALHRAFGLEPG
jgi:aspartate kinase